MLTYVNKFILLSQIFVLQLLIEVPYIFIQSIMYGLIIYSMLGFPWKAKKFCWYIYDLFVSLMYFVIYGMMAVGLTPNASVADIVSTFCYGLWSLYSGFIIPHTVSSANICITHHITKN